MANPEYGNLVPFSGAGYFAAGYTPRGHSRVLSTPKNGLKAFEDMYFYLS